MTGQQIVADLLWRNSIERMRAANAEPARRELRDIAESRLAVYFAQVEHMIARKEVANPPGDRNRQAV
jgi:hypothetical protein